MSTKQYFKGINIFSCSGNNEGFKTVIEEKLGLYLFHVQLSIQSKITKYYHVWYYTNYEKYILTNVLMIRFSHIIYSLHYTLSESLTKNLINMILFWVILIYNYHNYYQYNMMIYNYLLIINIDSFYAAVT